MSDAWTLYWLSVGNENYLAAKQLLELSPRVENHFKNHAHADRLGGHEVDWQRAGATIDETGMSTTEANLAHLVMGLLGGREGHDHPILLTTLGNMGSWTDDVLRILVDWATDGRLTLQGRLLADDPWVRAMQRPQD